MDRGECQKANELLLQSLQFTGLNNIPDLQIGSLSTSGASFKGDDLGLAYLETGAIYLDMNKPAS